MRTLRRLFLAIMLGAGLWLAFVLHFPTQPQATQSVLLRPGWSSRRIALELRQAGIIRSSTAFLLVHYLRERPLKAGEYRFDRPINALEAYDRIARGDIYFHTV